jgi:hypothetical protein
MEKNKKLTISLNNYLSCMALFFVMCFICDKIKLNALRAVGGIKIVGNNA